MKKNPVKVCLRTRPTATFAQDQIMIDQDKNTITINNGHVHADGGPSNKKDSWQFKYHQVLHNASQETVYETITRDVVQGVVEGINGTIMSYGQTGAGKTFTMIGDTKNYVHRGIAPRAIAHIYQEVQQRVETVFDISVSYMEIYNERIYDLLDDLTNAQQSKELTVAEDKVIGVHVRGLTQVPCKTEEEALDILFGGELSRTTAEHLLNKRSNRSHCIFTVHISQRPRMGASEKVMFSKLNLVDLAGSERLKKTMADGDEAPTKGRKTQNQQGVDDTIKKESMYINQSLTYLEQCVVALSKRGNAHIPYRQTKLTSVLKDSLGGNCNTLMFAAVWGEAKHLEETVSTLKLAQRMMRVQNDVGVNVQTDPAMLVKKYERQIKELKQELMMHDTLSERSNVMYDEYTSEQRLQMQQWVRSYVDAQENSEPELVVESVRHVQELMRQFKTLVKTSETNALQMRNQSRGGGLVDFDGTAEAGALGGMTQTFPENEGNFVGDIDDEGGFGVGAAPDMARPTTVDNIATRRGMAQADSKLNSPGSPKKSRDGGDAKTSMPAADAKNILNDKDESFAMYKINQGQPLNSDLADAKAKFKIAKQRAKNAADAVNRTKQDIDDVEDQLRLKEHERESTQNKVEGMDDFVDEEEFRLMTTRKEKKREYRANFENLKALKEEMSEASNRVETSRNELVSAFETWHASVVAGSADPDEDKLDEAEAFDQLEISRVVDTDPESLAFFQSNKKTRLKQNANKNTLKASQRAKRR